MDTGRKWFYLLMVNNTYDCNDPKIIICPEGYGLQESCLRDEAQLLYRSITPPFWGVKSAFSSLSMTEDYQGCSISLRSRHKGICFSATPR